MARSSWWMHPWTLTAAGGVLLFASFPPLGLWPLAIVALWPWWLLVRQPELAGRRPWLSIYLAGWASWLLLLYYIRVPHWLLNFGWLVMAAYLAAYVPGLIAATRVAVHRWGWSLWIAAPVMWMGTEFLRSFLFGGFAMSLLGHTLTPVPIAIQIADLSGGYGVSAALALLSVLLLEAIGEPLLQRVAPAAAAAWQLPPRPLSRRLLAAGSAVGLVLATLAYGQYRIAQIPNSSPNDDFQVALVQGTIDTTFPETAAEADAVREETFDQYQRLTQEALREHPEIDLVVWPEGKFTAGPDVVFDPAALVDEPLRLQAMQEHQRSLSWMRGQALGQDSLAGSPPWLLVGCSTWEYGGDDSEAVYNSALLFDPQGEIVQRYFKMHRVMFGEYIPLGDWFPILYDLTPIGQGLTAGPNPIALELEGRQFSPSICFESTVPHLMRQHVQAFRRAGESPDALVNLSDDGWFYGTAALDHHLACHVFRAVELRIPVLVAANTGLSAIVDAAGRRQQQGPRREEEVLVGGVPTAARAESLYLQVGDVLPTLTLVVLLTAWLVGGRRRWRAWRKR